MLLLRFFVWVWSIGAIVLGAGVVSGQNYPNKPIRIVAPGAGGGGDFAARLIAQGLAGSLGQQVIVENRGGSVIIHAQIVAQAPPDGYTLLCHGSPLWLLPFMQDNVPYDPVKDFSPITLAVSSPNVLVVHPTVAANSVKELIALARTRPGSLNYASAITGAASHLAGELFKSMAGVNIVRISYKGTPPAINALIGGEVQLMFATPASVMPHVRSGRLRALAVTSAQPSLLFPDLPAIAGSGLPGYEAASVFGIFAPAGTSTAIINRLNREMVLVLNQADVKEKFFIAGVEPVGSSPAQFRATMKSDMARMGKVIKDAGIREQ